MPRWAGRREFRPCGTSAVKLGINEICEASVSTHRFNAATGQPFNSSPPPPVMRVNEPLLERLKNKRDFWRPGVIPDLFTTQNSAEKPCILFSLPHGLKHAA